MLWWISRCRTTGNPGGSPWVGAEVLAGGGDASGVSPGCQPRCLLSAPRGPGAALGAREPSSPRVRCPREGRSSWGTGRGHLRTSSLHPRGPWPRCSCQAGQEGWAPPLSSTGEGPKGVFVWLRSMCRGLEIGLEQLSPCGQVHVRFGGWVSLQNPTILPTNPVWDPLLFFSIP